MNCLMVTKSRNSDEFRLFVVGLPMIRVFVVMTLVVPQERQRMKSSVHLASHLHPRVLVFTELDALRQRQARRPIDRVGLAAHIGPPGIRAGLAPAAGFFFAAKRPADLSTTRANIDIGDAAV